jgi:branched-chain amino acid transport system substrate-binding protein
MRARNYFVGAAFALLASGMAHSAMAEDIKIGEINSYSLLPAFTEPYRKGWQLAVEEINAAGGINGKKLVVISKDDGGKPADAQTAANELVSSEGVAMLTGTFLSNIGLAVSDFANQKKVFFLAAEPLTDAVTCRPRCSSRPPRSCRPSAGRRSRRTMSTASPRSRCSRS